MILFDLQFGINGFGRIFLANNCVLEMRIHAKLQETDIEAS